MSDPLIVPRGRAAAARRALPARLVGAVLLLLGGLVLGASSPAGAQTSGPYRVGGVKVEAKAKTPDAAKRAAVARGLPLALRRLVRRLAGSDANARLPRASARLARDLLLGYEVEAERFTDDGYTGTLAYRFDRARVRGWLRDQGVRVVEKASRPVLVLPVWRAERGLILWDEPNPWRAAWTRLELGGDRLVPIVTGAGDLQDLQAIDGPQAAAGDASALAAIAKRYEAGSVVVAVASPADGKVRIAVRRYFVPGGRMRPMTTLTAERGGEALAAAARQIAAALDRDWRQRSQIDDTRSATLRAVAPLDGLAYWTALRKRLGDVPLVRKYRVVQFSGDRSILDIEYAGSADQLREAMADAGLSLAPDRTAGPDRWVVRLMRAGEDAAPPAAVDRRRPPEGDRRRAPEDRPADRPAGRRP